MSSDKTIPILDKQLEEYVSRLNRDEREQLKDQAHEHLGRKCMLLHSENRRLHSKLREAERARDALKKEKNDRAPQRSYSRSKSPGNPPTSADRDIKKRCRDYEDTNKKLNRENKKLSEDIDDLKAKKEEAENASEKYSCEVAAVQQKFERFKRETSDKAELVKLNAKVEAKKEYEEEINLLIKSHDKIILELNTKLDQEKKRQAKPHETSELKALTETNEAKLSELKTEYDQEMECLTICHEKTILELKTELDSLKQEYDAQKMDFARVRKESEELRQTLRKSEEKVTTLTMENMKLQSKLTQFEEDQKNFKRKIQDEVRKDFEVNKKKFHDDLIKESQEHKAKTKEFYKRRYESMVDSLDIKGAKPFLQSPDPKTPSDNSFTKDCRECTLKQQELKAMTKVLEKQKKIPAIINKSFEEEKALRIQEKQQYKSQSLNLKIKIQELIEEVKALKKEKDCLRADLCELSSSQSSSLEDTSHVIFEKSQLAMARSRSKILQLQTELSQKTHELDQASLLDTKIKELEKYLEDVVQELADRQALIDHFKSEEIKHNVVSEKVASLQKELDASHLGHQRAEEAAETLKKTNCKLQKELKDCAAQSLSVHKVEPHEDWESLSRIYGLHLAQKDKENGRLKKELSEAIHKYDMLNAQRIRAENARNTSR